MCVPRLGRMSGTSASSCSSSGRRRSAHTPVALTTLSARTTNSLAARGVAHADAAGAPALLDQLGDLAAVGADRAEALGLAQHGQHQPGVVGLAVVEEVARRRLARGERRQQLDDLVAGDDAVAVGAPRRRRLAGPSRRRRAPRAAAAQLVHRHDVVEVQPHARSCGPGRAPSNAGTISGSGLTRCGASPTMIWRSSSASRTRPRSKFCR